MELIAEELSAMLLMRMKQHAERCLGTKVEHAVITIPGYFNDRQRNSTLSAA